MATSARGERPHSLLASTVPSGESAAGRRRFHHPWMHPDRRGCSYMRRHNQQNLRRPTQLAFFLWSLSGELQLRRCILKETLSVQRKANLWHTRVCLHLSRHGARKPWLHLTMCMWSHPCFACSNLLLLAPKCLFAPLAFFSKVHGQFDKRPLQIFACKSKLVHFLYADCSISLPRTDKSRLYASASGVRLVRNLHGAEL